jgi:hypothetical protein
MWLKGRSQSQFGAGRYDKFKLKQAADSFEHVSRFSAKRTPCGSGSCLRSPPAQTTAAVILGPERGEEKCVGGQPTLSGGEAAAQRPVLSGGAGKRVRTTQRGLSTQRKIGIRETSRAPDHLAREIPLLRPLSATRLRLACRRSLVGRGCNPAVIRSLQLVTEEDLAGADDGARDDDGPPEPPRCSL